MAMEETSQTWGTGLGWEGSGNGEEVWKKL